MSGQSADSNNGLAARVAGIGHTIYWDEAEVVCREEQWTKRKITESLTIKTHANNLNLDNGAFINPKGNPPQ